MLLRQENPTAKALPVRFVLMVQYVRMTIRYESGDPLPGLDDAFGRSRPLDLIDRPFWVAQHLHAMRGIDYAAECNEGLIIACARAESTLQILFEPTPGSDVQRSCETLWQGFRRASTTSRPRLEQLEVRRPGVALPSMSAHTGIREALKSRETKLLLLAACVTILILVGMIALDLFETATRDVLIGGLPAIIAGATALLLGAHEARGQRLFWDI